MVSIIVPVYNVEKYLRPCVDSLLAQSGTEYEILLVDDGSADGCPAICDGYRRRFPGKIRVVHKRNGGLSDARNAGMREAKGEYFLFVDSDDLIHPFMLRTLWEQAERTHSDLAACRYRRFTGRPPAPEAPAPRCTVMTGEELLHGIYTGGVPGIDFVVWNKLYRRRLFDDEALDFAVGRYHEDEFIAYRLLSAARRAAVVDAPLYYYRTRPGSIMTSPVAQREQDLSDALLAAVRGLPAGSRTREDALYRYLMRLYDRSRQADGESARRLRTEYRQALADYGPLRRSALKRKLRVLVRKYA